MKEAKLFELVTGTEMKPWLSRNMLPNINTCKNDWSNFSANLKVVSLKILELTQFAWPKISIYFTLLCAVPRNDVIESTRFLIRPPVNHSTMVSTAIPSLQLRSLHICYTKFTFIQQFLVLYSSSFDLLWVLYLIIFPLSGQTSVRHLYAFSNLPLLGKRQYASSSRMPRCCRWCSRFSHNKEHFWVPLT